MKIYIVTPPNGKRGYDCAQGVVDLLRLCPDVEIVENAIDAEIIVVIGGDGTMLYAIQQFQILRIPFVGLDCGTRGFLMGPVAATVTEHLCFESLNFIKLPLFDVELTDVGGNVHKTTAFNDAYIKAKHVMTCHGTVRGDYYPEKRFVGDGIIVATPQGSTAYNHSAGGAILPLRQEIMGVCTICSMTPRIRSAVDYQQITVEVTRDDVVAVADNRRFDRVVKMAVSPGNKTVAIGFVKGYNFEARRYED